MPRHIIFIGELCMNPLPYFMYVSRGRVQYRSERGFWLSRYEPFALSYQEDKELQELRLSCLFCLGDNPSPALIVMRC